MTSNRKASSPRCPLTWSQKLLLSLSPNQSLSPCEHPALECSGKAGLSHHIPLRKTCPALVSTCHQTFRFLSVSRNETSVPGRQGLGFAQPYRTKTVPSTQWVFPVNEEANPVITLQMARVKPREGGHLPRATGFTCPVPAPTPELCDSLPHHTPLPCTHTHRHGDTHTHTSPWAGTTLQTLILQGLIRD